MLYLSSEKEDKNFLSRKYSSERIMDFYSFAFLSTLVISRCSRATTARKSTKKRDARGSTCKVVVLLIYALLFYCSRCSPRRCCSLKKGSWNTTRLQNFHIPELFLRSRYHTPGSFPLKWNSKMPFILWTSSSLQRLWTFSKTSDTLPMWILGEVFSVFNASKKVTGNPPKS